MFVKNKLSTYLNIKLAGRSVGFPPGGIGVISDEQAEDDYFHILVERGWIEEAQSRQMSEQIDKEQEKKKEKSEKKIPVQKHEDKVTDGTIVAKCAARYKNGRVCEANVNVPQGEFDSDTPYFCRRHAAENPADYEKVDGAWEKKRKPETSKKRGRSKKSE